MFPVNKYQPLFQYVTKQNKDILNLSFQQIENILNFEIDHSLLNYKKNLLEYGFKIKKISLKGQYIIFEKIK